MNPPYIPHTSLDGTLITGWCGPHLVPFYRGAGSPPEWVLKPYAGSPAWSDGGDERRLDPRSPEVAHRIADVLRAKGHEVGHLLPVALGGRQGDVTAEAPCIDCDGSGWHIADNAAPWGCPTCGGSEGANKGSGTIRRTIPAADVSALTLAASVAGVEAERGVVRGVLGEWREDHWTHYRDGLDGHQRVWTYIRAGDRAHDGDGWAIGRPTKATPKGPETGPEGRAAADAALLRLGYAYLDPAAPFGIVVPFLRDGREVGS